MEEAGGRVREREASGLGGHFRDKLSFLLLWGRQGHRLGTFGGSGPYVAWAQRRRSLTVSVKTGGW